LNYYSTNNREQIASFEGAVFNSLPPDNGLYFPEHIPKVSYFLGSMASLTKEDIGFEIARHFVDHEIPENILRSIVAETVNFDLPLVAIDEKISAMELFHGPTWAFKDVGARFLSRCMGYFNESREKEVHVLVATSGDTGGAVAAGFYGVEGVKVTILFPKGKVSDVQQQQLTSWGDNIQALEIDGSFDDCQKLVKTAFLDKDLNGKINLSSANSINIARLIPQSFYYFFTFQQLENWENVVFSIPSGNYGNLSAGLLAWKMGLPIKRFIAASNANKIVPDYLNTGEYKPKESVQTYANAMDVGAPSNFVRVLEIFRSDHGRMCEMIEGFSLSDEEILATMRQCNDDKNYVLDPHGAIGYEALRQLLKPEEQGIFFETAHPVKFVDVVEKALGRSVDYTDKIEGLMQRSAEFTSLPANFEELKGVLM